MMIVLYIVVLHLLRVSEGCSCIAKSVQSIFCESDFVALVTVVNETYVADEATTEAAQLDEDYPDGVPQLSFRLVFSDDNIKGSYFYEVDVVHVYVAGLVARSALYSKRVTVKTDADPGLCGLRLTIGKSGLITAKIDPDDGIPAISSCNAILEDFENFTPFQLKALNYLYKRSCNCKPAMNIMCEEGQLCTNSDECALLPSDGEKSCYDRYSVCMKKMYGRCEWRQSKKFKECLAGTLKEV